jgi:hypothetical protein
VNEYERKRLLERIEREGATVGAHIPETVTVEADDGTESFALREFVHGVQRLGDGAADPGEVAAVKKRLRRERLRRRQRIEDDEVTRPEGERIVEEVVGIDRALNALENLDSDPESEASAREVADRKRWRSFLRRALGREESQDRPAGGRGGLGGQR